MIYDQKAIAPSRVSPQTVNITHLPPLAFPNPLPLDVRCPAATLSCPVPNITYIPPTIIYSTSPPITITSCPPPADVTSPPTKDITSLDPRYHSAIVESVYHQVMEEIKSASPSIWRMNGTANNSGTEEASAVSRSPPPTPTLPICSPPTGVNKAGEEVHYGERGPGDGSDCCWQIDCGQPRLGGNYEDDPHQAHLSQKAKEQTLLPRSVPPPPQSSPTSTIALTAKQTATSQSAPAPKGCLITYEERVGFLEQLFELFRSGHCKEVDGELKCEQFSFDWSGNEDMVVMQFIP